MVAPLVTSFKEITNEFNRFFAAVGKTLSSSIPVVSKSAREYLLCLNFETLKSSHPVVIQTVLYDLSGAASGMKVQTGAHTFMYTPLAVLTTNRTTKNTTEV